MSQQLGLIVRLVRRAPSLAPLGVSRLMRPLLGVFVFNAWKPPSDDCGAFSDAMAEVALDMGIENIVLAAARAAYPGGRIQEVGAGALGEEDSQAAFQSGLQRTLAVMGARDRQVWIVVQVPQARYLLSGPLYDHLKADAAHCGDHLLVGVGYHAPIHPQPDAGS